MMDDTHLISFRVPHTDFRFMPFVHKKHSRR